jgi:ribosomal protein S4
MRKPFHLKTKLFYQTKINLWGWDLGSIKFKFKKKKWGFLKGKYRRNFKKGKLDSFRFSPFSRNFFKGRGKLIFKNNLYFRKLMRLKYGRLKNKEFYKIFKRYKGYKKFITKFGSRLDTNLFLLLSPISVFYLRQSILHGKVLVNGLKVYSPNINLKLFDMISLKFSSFLNTSFIYKNNDSIHLYYFYLVSRLFDFSGFKYLDEVSRLKFSQDITNLFPLPWHSVAFECFHSYLVLWCTDEREYRTFYEGGTESTSLINLVNILNKQYFKKELLKKKSLRERRFLLSGIGSSSAVKDKILGFFNNRFNPNSFEVRVNGDHLDVVFLGFSTGGLLVKTNEKYLLHYLY